MTIDKIKKIIKLRSNNRFPKHFEYILYKFKINNYLKKYIYGISYRTSISFPNDKEVDLDIHPLFKSKKINDEEKIKFTNFFLKNSIECLKKLKISDKILRYFLYNLKKEKERPFDLKICFSWDKKTINPIRYTIYINYNSQKHMLNLLNNILPKSIIKNLKKIDILIDTIAIDVFLNGKKNYKIYYRQKISNSMKMIKKIGSKITSIYLMKSFPQKREKIYIHFSNSIKISSIKNILSLIDKKISNTTFKTIKIPSYAKLYFISYTKKPNENISLYLR